MGQATSIHWDESHPNGKGPWDEIHPHWDESSQSSQRLIKACYNVYAQNRIQNTILGPEGSAEGFCGRFPRKVILEGRRILRKVLAEGFCGRFRGRFFFTYAQNHIFWGRMVPRKVFAEGSAEGVCGRFRGRFLRKVSCGRFVGKVSGRIPEGFRKVLGLQL